MKDRWTSVRRPDSEGPLSFDYTNKISGYLNKQGEKGLMKTWKKRWFVFDKETGELFYHLSESTPQPIGVIDMAYCEVHRNSNPTNKREFTIHYITTGRIYYLIAASEQEVGYWVTHLLEWKGSKKNTIAEHGPGRYNSRSLTVSSRPKGAHISISPPATRSANEIFTRSAPSTPSLTRNGAARTTTTLVKRGQEANKESETREQEGQSGDEVILNELSQRLFAEVQDVHSVRNMLSSFHRPLTASDTQYLSMQLVRHMEYLNLVLQEVSHSAVAKEELEPASDEYVEEEITGHFFLLPSGLAYYLFSFLQPADLSRACQVCRTWRSYAENPVLWAQFMATPSSKYDNQRNWKALYISTQQPKTKQQVRAVSIYGSPPTVFEGAVKEGWLHKRGEDLLKMWKRRWFVIRENCLIYYKTPKDNLPCGVIPLSDLTFALVKGTGRKHCFKLSNQSASKSGQIPHGGKVECVLSADSDEDCLAWVSELHMVMRRASKLPSLENITSASARKSSIPPLNRSASAINFSTPPEKVSPYFGVPLASIMTRQQEKGDETKIPTVIDKALTFLTEKALDEEGLLRISGSVTELQLIRNDIEQDKEIDFTSHDPHAVAGIVKCFFRELPERLVPTDLNNYAATVAADTSGDGPNSGNLKQKLDEFRFILHSLPKNNHNLLRALHAEKNKMNENNILRVIIPTIHCNPQLLAYSMRHFDVLFNDGYL